MNTRLFRIVCMLFVAFVAMSAHGQFKLAVVNATEAIFESTEAKELMQAVETEIEPERQRLQDLQEEIQALESRRQTDNEIMSDTEKVEMDSEIEDKTLDFNFGVERFQKKINDERTKIFNTMGPKFNAVLNDLIQLEGYDLVLNWNPQIVLFVNQKHNVTRKVTELLNERQGQEIPLVEEGSETTDESGEASTEE